MLGKSKSTVGLDIGSAAIKVVEISHRGKEPRLANCGVVETSTKPLAAP